VVKPCQKFRIHWKLLYAVVKVDVCNFLYQRALVSPLPPYFFLNWTQECTSMSLVHDLLVYIPLPQIPPHSPLFGHIMSKKMQDLAHYIILQSVRIFALFWQVGAVPCHPFHPKYLHSIMCTNKLCTHKFFILHAIHHCSNTSESMLDKDG
jgi:hypothetical protein